MTTPSWKDVLPVPPPGARLHEAWMTSFEQPDAGFLVEHLLPSLLGASHSLSQEAQDRALFFGELGTTLEALHGRLTVISSPQRESREASQYPWLWRYMSHFTVGAKSHAVQHAKLWAFHWKVNGEELIDLHVSSTNLTASAFKSQVQAGWQVSLRLGKRNNQTIRKTWGDLVPFLDALGDSAGDVAASRIARLVALLGRVECPAGVTFVASIPGDKSAARKLKMFTPSELHVLAPTIGEWNKKSLSDWCTDLGVDTSKVHLKWIALEHPWAELKGWTLSTSASLALKENGVQLDCLPNDARFTREHLDGDNRWSHAKLYLIRSRNKKKRRLLITSANWSPSAWGVGKQSPRNFELGVVIETEWTGLEKMGKPFDKSTAIFCTVDAGCNPDDLSLQWAEASWDGKRIQLCARSTDSSMPIYAIVTFSCGTEKSLALTGGTATMSCTSTTNTPLTARFTQGTEALEVDILDLRLPTAFAKTPLPEVDPDLATKLREAFLLQRYGGPVVDISVPTTEAPMMRRQLGGGAQAADYSVQNWIDARVAFEVVDNWRAALMEAKRDPVLLDRARLDGKELRVLYARRQEVAATLVAEELGWHLSEKT